MEVGETRLAFVAGSGEPFYHVALLVPGYRFASALEWVEKHVKLLPDRETGEVVFDFDTGMRWRATSTTRPATRRAHWQKPPR